MQKRSPCLIKGHDFREGGYIYGKDSQNPKELILSSIVIVGFLSWGSPYQGPYI